MGVGTVHGARETHHFSKRNHECALVLFVYNLELLFPYTTQRYHGANAVNFFLEGLIISYKYV